MPSSPCRLALLIALRNPRDERAPLSDQRGGATRWRASMTALRRKDAN